ncbi:MAG: hypothetical protein IPK04_15875 [Bdellovibrionales bacterium]|nr:hypothetical protein [Bdellovibrionales bacterium]
MIIVQDGDGVAVHLPIPSEVDLKESMDQMKLELDVASKNPEYSPKPVKFGDRYLPSNPSNLETLRQTKSVVYSAAKQSKSERAPKVAL